MWPPSSAAQHRLQPLRRAASARDAALCQADLEVQSDGALRKRLRKPLRRAQPARVCVRRAGGDLPKPWPAGTPAAPPSPPRVRPRSRPARRNSRACGGWERTSSPLPSAGAPAASASAAGDARGGDLLSPSASRSAAAAAPVAAGAAPAAAACSSCRARAARAPAARPEGRPDPAPPILEKSAWRAFASCVADHTGPQPQSVATAGRRLLASGAPDLYLLLTTLAAPAAWCAA